MFLCAVVLISCRKADLGWLVIEIKANLVNKPVYSGFYREGNVMHCKAQVSLSLLEFSLSI